MLRPRVHRLSLPCLAVIATTLLGSLAPSATLAATVRQLGVADLLRGSQFIFHGVAVERQVVAGARKGEIFTRVTFRVQEVIRGPSVDRLELDFLGGTLNGLTLSVSDMTVPAVGEEGVFFVEQLDHAQVNPLYGWWQGYFVVHADAAGNKFVTTFGRQPVYDLQPDSIPMAGGISEGAAAGVVTEAAGANRSPMTLDQFKNSLRRMLEITQ